MIEICGQLANVDRLAAWLEKIVRPALRPDVSNYAKGRLRVWLGEEPMLVAPFNTRPGLAVAENVVTRLKELVEWDYDFCLVTYSGDRTAVGITPHMDAGYADFEARSIHVTGECRFDYWCNRESFGKGPKIGGFDLDRQTYQVLDRLGEEAEPTHALNLAPGSIVRFNCKDPHAATPGLKRWNLNFWRRKP